MLVWRVVSADGHPVGGSLIFSVGAPSVGGPPEAIAPAYRSVQAALWLSKVVLYAGLFLGVGGAFFLAWIGSTSDRARALILGVLRLGLIAASLSVGLQGLDALGLPLTALVRPSTWEAGFGTSYGNTVTAALLALLGGDRLHERAVEGGLPAALARLRCWVSALRLPRAATPPMPRRIG